MVRLDIGGLSTRDVNRKLKEAAANEDEIVVVNTHSVHNFATALKGSAKITVEGSTGFYTGGFLAGPSLHITGNTGWYTGDNMSAGEIIVDMNTGSNCAPNMIGGTILVRGHSGSRAGFGMKGGNLIVCGNAGMWVGQMTLGGRIILLGEVGPGLGESMYKGVIHCADPDAEKKLGGNVKLADMEESERAEVAALLEKYGIDQNVEQLKSVVPKVYGRHEYHLFQPTHKQAVS